MKLSTFIRKFDVNHDDGDPLYGHTLGYILIIAGWVMLFGFVWAMSHQYWTVEFWTSVWQDTLTNLRNNYIP